MVHHHIGVGRASTRAKYWFRICAGKEWRGPFYSYAGLAREINEANLQLYASPERLRFLIEKNGGPLSGSCKVVRGFHRGDPAAGFFKALGIKRVGLSHAERIVINELLDALGPESNKKSGAGLGNVRRLIAAAKKGSGKSMLPLLITGDFSRARLMRLSASNIPVQFDMAGDFSMANFSGSKFEQIEPSLGPILSGLFVSAKFERVRFQNAHLTGDFAKADFKDAILESCVLSGKFNGANFKKTSIRHCVITEKASFRGADLRGLVACFQNVSQIAGAKILQTDLIGLRGKKVVAGSKTFQLITPFNAVTGSEVPAPGEGSAFTDTETTTDFLDDFPSDDFNARGEPPVLLDMPGRTIKGRRANRLELCRIRAYAPRMHVTGVRGRNILNLVGNFDGGRFIKCDIFHLNLRSGSFRGMDLDSAKIRRLSIYPCEIDATGLILPQIRSVEFFIGEEGPSPFGNWIHNFHLPAQRARSLLDAWNSSSDCEILANDILVRNWPKPTRLDVGSKIFASKEISVVSLMSSLGLTGADWIPVHMKEALPAILLIVRRNTLEAANHAR